MQTKASLLLLLLFVFIPSVAQKKEPIYKITYTKNYNGNIITANPIVSYATSKSSIITNEDIENNTASLPFEKMVYNSVTNKLTKVSTLSKNNHISTIDSTSLKKYEFTITDEFKTILGYKCQKATTVINSNHIDVWFTNDIAVKSAPSPLGITLGLVLETNRNNNYIITVSKVEKIKGVLPTIQDDVKTYDGLTYNDLIWKSKFKTISVFENEIINFSKESVSNDSILRFANGTIILKKIKFSEIKKRDQIFIDLTLQSNGDAYDRTGSVFLIPQDKKTSFFDGLQNGVKTLPIYTNGNGKEYQGIISTENYNPLIELMRFFTPFGVHQYNYISLKDKEWFDKAFYRQDISDLNTYLSNNEYWIGTFIGNYDKGGHKVSVNITIHNEEGNEKAEKLVMPLFNTTNIMEMAGQNYGSLFDNEKGLIVEFSLDKAIKNAQLKYIATGHGGWENGDEFVPKENTFALNGNIIHAFTPWRQDCGSYRLYNPASGNFNNGLSSSDYSRSNWCPGTVTNPTYINLGNLPAGKHTLQIKIPQGKPEGNSFSFWNISGLLIGE